MLTKKLKTKGLIYIEFPSLHTASLPSLAYFNVTFNFYDDKDHKKRHKKEDIINLLENKNFTVIKAKVFFNWKKLLFFPLILFVHRNQISKSLYELWNFVGWSTLILAIKS